MNEVFLNGRIITEIEFKFIINTKKQKSIVEFTLEIENGLKVKIKAYNEIADYIYSKFKMYDDIILRGMLSQEYDVIIKEIVKF